MKIDWLSNQNNLNELKHQVDSLIKDNTTLQHVVDDMKSKNTKLQMNVEGLRNEKQQLIQLMQVVMKVVRREEKYKGIVLLYQEGIAVCDSVMTLRNEQLNVKMKIDMLMNSKGCVGEDGNCELGKMVEKEKNTLVQLYSELDGKVNEKEKRMNDIKNEIENSNVNTIKVDKEGYSNQIYNDNSNSNYDANLTDYDFEEQHHKINNAILNYNYYNNGMFNNNINYSPPISMNNTTLTTNGNPLNQLSYNLKHKN